MSQELMSVEGQLVGMPLAGPESFSQQQLEYLKRALGVDETVLWENSSGDFVASLSESLFNFQKIKVFQSAGVSYHVQEFYTSDLTSNQFMVGAVYKPATSTQLAAFASLWTISNNGTTIESTGKGIGITSDSSATSFYNGNIYHGKIRRVVGIGRKETA